MKRSDPRGKKEEEGHRVGDAGGDRAGIPRVVERWECTGRSRRRANCVDWRK